MIRILQGKSATLTKTLYVDGVATNPTPDSATIGITRDDGTTLVAAGTATTDTGTGTFSYTLTPAQTATLDSLTVTWTATFSGQSQTFVDIVEIAGGVLFTIAQARAVSPLSNTVTYTTAKITDARTMVETALEEACGVAFVPRYKRETVHGTGTRELLLSMPRIRTIRSVELDGTAISASDLATLAPSGPGVVDYPYGWTAGFGNYEVAYEHGYDFPPPRVSQAALLWAKNFLVQGPISDRTTSMVTDDGTFAMSVPGMRGVQVGIPEVDAVIQQYNLVAGVA